MRVLLLSGGIDSAALAKWCDPQAAITFNYGQRPAVGELRAATKVADALGLEHHIVEIDCSALGTGFMAGKSPSKLSPNPEWWPYRNQLLLTLAAMRFIASVELELLIGTVSTDVSHNDGRQEFRNGLNALFQTQEGHVTVSAPAAHMTTAELISQSGIEADLLGWTFSCHVTDPPCGRCRGCLKHAAALAGHT